MAAAMGGILIGLIMVIITAPAAYAVQHTVGGSNQWDQGVDYDQWAQGETFTVGDTLLFTYSGLHSVDQVKESEYSSCNSGSPIKRNSGGSTTVTLSSPGTYYFICPTGGHCDGGMKLAVTVPGATTTSPPSTVVPNSPPSTVVPNSPRMGSNGNFREVSYLVVGFFMFAAAVINWF